MYELTAFAWTAVPHHGQFQISFKKVRLILKLKARHQYQFVPPQSRINEEC